MDLYGLWEALKINVPVFTASLPTPITSSRRSTIQITYNPRTSETKEIDFSVAIGEF